MIAPEQVVFRLALAALLGAVVGIERERLERAAGLRTHALVGVGAALFMLVSAFGFADILQTSHVDLDPSRVAAQVVSGIGFLGAGTIIFQREIVRGLTTAASIWAVAAIGLAVGGGLYLAASAATVLILLILAGLKPIENRFFLRRRLRLLTLTMDRQMVSLYAVERAVQAAGLRLERLLIQPGPADDEDQLEIIMSRPRTEALDALIDDLRRLPGVRRISSTRLPGGLTDGGETAEDDTDDWRGGPADNCSSIRSVIVTEATLVSEDPHAAPESLESLYCSAGHGDAVRLPAARLA